MDNSISRFSILVCSNPLHCIGREEGPLALVRLFDCVRSSRQAEGPKQDPTLRRLLDVESDLFGTALVMDDEVFFLLGGLPPTSPFSAPAPAHGFVVRIDVVAAAFREVNRPSRGRIVDARELWVGSGQPEGEIEGGLEFVLGSRHDEIMHGILDLDVLLSQLHTVF